MAHLMTQQHILAGIQLIHLKCDYSHLRLSVCLGWKCSKIIYIFTETPLYIINLKIYMRTEVPFRKLVTIRKMASTMMDDEVNQKLSLTWERLRYCHGIHNSWNCHIFLEYLSKNGCHSEGNRCFYRLNAFLWLLNIRSFRTHSDKHCWFRMPVFWDS